MIKNKLITILLTLMLILNTNTVRSSNLDNYFIIKWTSKNCIPCSRWDKNNKKELEKHFKIVYIDVDKNPELAKKYKVNSIPQFWVCTKEPYKVYNNYKFIGENATSSFLFNEIQKLDRTLK